MAPFRLAPNSVDPRAADAAHEELVKFVDSRNPGVVHKKPDTAVTFDPYLKTADLQKTNALVDGFLLTKGKRLAAEFLEAEDVRLVRSFIVLYCARQTRKKQTGLGKATMFVALGPLSSGNGLPKFENGTGKDLASGDALLIGSDIQQLLDTNGGGGFAIVSEWTV